MKNFLFFLTILSLSVLFLTGCHTESEDIPVSTPQTTPVMSAAPAEKEIAETKKPEKTEKPKKEGDKAMTNNCEDYFSISEITEEILTRIQGKSYPEDCPLSLDTLRYVTVAYVDFEENICRGELIVHTEIAEKILCIFKELLEENYPIERISLIDNYDANDDKSMAANNSSAFCYRVISGTDKLSNHSFGLAVDINPLYNPYIKSNGQVLPEEAEVFADRTLSNPYYLTPDNICVHIFKKYGFTWGGDWKSSKDYQHFEYEL